MNGARLLQVQLALLPAAAIAAANFFAAGWLRGGEPQLHTLALGWLVAVPFVQGLLAVGTLGRTSPPPPAPLPEPPAAPPPPPPERDDTAALRLLAALQEEGRLVDFLQENLSSYSDEQIGAAARGIHAGAAKALHACVPLEPVVAASEGDSISIPPGFDPAAVRLLGNVSGDPPFVGVLRHPGWRATRVTLPARRGEHVEIVAPAEVEIA
jgi:hypothetical protein